MIKRINCKSKQKKTLRVVVIGIIIATFFWFSFFSKRLAAKIISTAKIQIDNNFHNMVNTIIKNNVKPVNLDKLLIFTKNKDGELILTKYNLKETYDLLEEINRHLIVFNNYIFFLPSGMYSKNFLLNYYGSKIPIRVRSSGNIFTNIKTKITNYGINNALAEIYVVIEMNWVIISPFDKAIHNKKYEILLASYFITGKVPNIYGDKYEISSNVFDINEKI